MEKLSRGGSTPSMRTQHVCAYKQLKKCILHETSGPPYNNLYESEVSRSQ